MDLNTKLVTAGVSATAAVLAYKMLKSDDPIDPLYDFNQQSIVIDEVEQVRICTSMKGKKIREYRFDDVRTLYDILPKGLELSCNGPCLAERSGPGKGPYTWITYSEVIQRTRYVGSGLLNMGIESDHNTNIGIYSSNRIEWPICEHACYGYSFPVVSLYDSYGKESIQYIMNHAELKAIFVDSKQRIENICEALSTLDSTYLKLIIYFDNIDEKSISSIRERLRHNVQIVSYQSLVKSGQEQPRSPIPPKPDDIATVCYTSGTTGQPKGALISHLNIICNEAAIHQRLDLPHLNYTGMNPRLVHYSYLPLAHMLERQAHFIVFLAGGRIGYISGDLTAIMSDLQELKPNDMPLVPRILNRLHAQVMSQLQGSPLKMALFKRAVAAKDADRKKGIYNRNTIYDRLVFKKIQNMFGGQLLKVATGSAPVLDEVMKFGKAAFGCPITEGYGQTECTCAVTFTHPFDPELGHVGPPVECCMVKLADVPEMNYFSKNNQGEICVKGPSIFKGYLKDPEKTAETIDKDGWLHTGDIGQWLPNGALKIIDRKKHLFKLSQGEYISPEKIEIVYSKSQFIAQCIVTGNPLKDNTVAIVVPEPEYLEKFCKEQLNLKGTTKELCQNPLVKKQIMADMSRLATQYGLNSVEKVKNIYLEPVLFSLDNGYVTPTLKMQRQKIITNYKPIIDALYREIEQKSSKL